MNEWIKWNWINPNFGELGQCPGGERCHDVVEEAERTERIVDAVEGVVGDVVQGVAFQIQRRQRRQTLEDVVVQPLDVVLRQVEERQRRQRRHRRRHPPLLRTFIHSFCIKKNKHLLECYYLNATYEILYNYYLNNTKRIELNMR